MQEIWKDISGYEGLYQVSDFGRVKSLGRIIHVESLIKGSHKRVKPVRIMKGIPDKDGYLQVNLFDENSVRTTRKVHQLVIKQFLGEPPVEGMVPDHKNGVRSDNRLTNLRWLTESQNHILKHTARGLSGEVGVCFRDGKLNPWQAYFTLNGRFKSLGHFPTKSAAVVARKNYERTVI
ncbi:MULTISPECIES: NUMOD4 motif-containing HNH endonuclease [unclassified Agrobacterium]